MRSPSPNLFYRGDTMSFTEANYENAIIQLFTGALGYTHAYGPDVPRD